MSELHQAVTDEIDAYRPDQTPPFEVLVDRHRRGRRRTAVTALAGAAAVVALAAAVVVPVLRGGGPDTATSISSGPAVIDAGAAAELCAAATERFGDLPLGAYTITGVHGTTVQSVRTYVRDPASAAALSPIYPALENWSGLAPGYGAVACYLDGEFPPRVDPPGPTVERLLIFAAPGVESFIARTGTRESLPADPIPLTGGGDVSRVSFLPEEAAYNDALLQGVLGGDPATGCLWVTSGDFRRALLLHSDTGRLDVSSDPPVIRDDTGVLAAFGNVVEGSGGARGPAAPGCEAYGPPFRGVLTASTPTPTALNGQEFLGVWTGPDGLPASRGASRDYTFELASRPMPDHCGWESAVVLQVPQPLGSTYVIGPESVPIRTYTRDVEGVLDGFEGAFRGELDLDATLPEGSTPTGYTLGDVALWFGPDGGEDYAYLVSPRGTEQWPVEVEPIGCA